MAAQAETPAPGLASNAASPAAPAPDSTLPDSTARGTLVGFGAVAVWALLVLLTLGSGEIPPFQRMAFCMTLGGALGLGWLAFKGVSLRETFAQTPRAWAIGAGGLFGYHAVYFFALSHAPPVAASLLNYLWPLLIVLMAGLATGQPLRLTTVLGALLGLAGAATAVLAESGFHLEIAPEHALGYAAALLAAFLWAGYSTLSRRHGAASTAAVAAFCFVSGLLAALCHLAFEPQTIWPATQGAWAAFVLLALGPMSAAFFLWDYGVKKGDLQTLGALAYMTPALSTAALTLGGFVAPRWSSAIACALIVVGAVLASRAGRRARG